jgi:hypothetical protein
MTDLRHNFFGPSFPQSDPTRAVAQTLSLAVAVLERMVVGVITKHHRGLSCCLARYCSTFVRALAIERDQTAASCLGTGPAVSCQLAGEEGVVGADGLLSDRLSIRVSLLADVHAHAGPLPDRQIDRVVQGDRSDGLADHRRRVGVSHGSHDEVCRGCLGR